MGGVKDQIMSFFKMEAYSQPKCFKTFYRGGKKPENKENKGMKARIIRAIKNLFEHQEKYYYKLVKVGIFRDNNYIKYKRSGDRNKNLSVKEYLNEIKPYLRDKILNLQKSDTWKIQLTIAINFISSKDVDKYTQ